MNPFTVTELERMRSTQESSMQDVCSVMEYTSTGNDAYGLPVLAHMPRLSSVCGFRLVSPRMLQSTGEVPVIDAMLRLPIDTSVGLSDRIRITHRYGEELDVPMDFTIEGPILRGPSGIRIKLKKVDDGSDTSI